MKVVLSCFLLASTLLGTQGQDSILSIDGSGTTNPSRCYWSIMEKMTAQAKLPFQLTYRAVGSTTGQAEFSNNFGNISVADFGSGDLPIKTDDYNMYQSAGIEIVHLPVLLGAVSIFHSVPIRDLNLTGCVLARIFKREITNWNDAEILEINEFNVDGTARMNPFISASLGLELCFLKRFALFGEARSGLGGRMIINKRPIGLSRSQLIVGLNYFFKGY